MASFHVSNHTEPNAHFEVEATACLAAVVFLAAEVAGFDALTLLGEVATEFSTSSIDDSPFEVMLSSRLRFFVTSLLSALKGFPTPCAFVMARAECSLFVRGARFRSAGKQQTALFSWVSRSGSASDSRLLLNKADKYTTFTSMLKHPFRCLKLTLD